MSSACLLLRRAICSLYNNLLTHVLNLLPLLTPSLILQKASGTLGPSSTRMTVLIGKICGTAFLGLYNKRHIRKFLTVQSTKTPIHAFVSLHPDKCNTLLFGLPKYQFDRLQKVHNAADRVIFQIAKFDHITPALIGLHRLPATFSVQFRLLLFVYKSLHNQIPLYIKDLLSLKPAANYALRSSVQSLLFVPKIKYFTRGDRAIAHVAPVLWNSLPLTIRTSGSLTIFKKHLKTFLFRESLQFIRIALNVQCFEYVDFNFVLNFRLSCLFFLDFSFTIITVITSFLGILI